MHWFGKFFWGGSINSQGPTVRGGGKYSGVMIEEIRYYATSGLHEAVGRQLEHSKASKGALTPSWMRNIWTPLCCWVLSIYSWKSWIIHIPTASSRLVHRHPRVTLWHTIRWKNSLLGSFERNPPTMIDSHFANKSRNVCIRHSFVLCSCFRAQTNFQSWLDQPTITNLRRHAPENSSQQARVQSYFIDIWWTVKAQEPTAFPFQLPYVFFFLENLHTDRKNEWKAVVVVVDFFPISALIAGISLLNHLQLQFLCRPEMRRLHQSWTMGNSLQLHVGSNLLPVELQWQPDEHRQCPGAKCHS